MRGEGNKKKKKLSSVVRFFFLLPLSSARGSGERGSGVVRIANIRVHGFRDEEKKKGSRERVRGLARASPRGWFSLL